MPEIKQITTLDDALTIQAKSTDDETKLFKLLGIAGNEVFSVDRSGVITGGTLSSSVFNVKDPLYGAVGNGVANDRVAIQAAVNAAIAAGGGTVYFPTGTYIISGGYITVATASKVRLIGDGRASILKKPNGHNSYLVYFQDATDCGVYDLCFDANGANQTANYETLIYRYDSHNFAVERCFFPNAKGFAIFGYTTPALGRPNNLRIVGNYYEQIAGSDFDGIVPTARGGYIAGNYVKYSAGVGMNVYEGDGMIVIGNTFVGTGAAGIGMQVSSCLNSVVAGNYFESSTNDKSIHVLKETDNGDARIGRRILIANNTHTGLSASSIFLRIENEQYEVTVKDNVVNGTAYFIQYITGPISDILCEGNVVTNIGLGWDSMISVTPTNVRYRRNQGDPNFGASAITVTASPMTYTAGNRPEVVYIKGGTVSAIAKNSRTLLSASPGTVYLEPGEAITVTYSSAPTMEKDVK